MEPISMIIAALVAGTAKSAGDAVPDAYSGLKALIKRRFAGEPVAEMILEQHETNPEIYKEPLKMKLNEVGADKDQEIIKLAQELLNQVKDNSSGQQIITQNVSNVKYAATSVSGNANISSISEHSTSKDK